MIKPSILSTINRYGQHDSNVIMDGLTTALALTPYIRFIEPSVGVRRYFIDIMKFCDKKLEEINEAYAINIDLVLSRAYNIFEARYRDAVFAKSTCLLDPKNNLHEVLLANVSALPPQRLVDLLLQDLQTAVKGDEKGEEA